MSVRRGLPGNKFQWFYSNFLDALNKEIKNFRSTYVHDLGAALKHQNELTIVHSTLRTYSWNSLISVHQDWFSDNILVEFDKLINSFGRFLDCHDESLDDLRTVQDCHDKYESQIMAARSRVSRRMRNKKIEVNDMVQSDALDDLHFSLANLELVLCKKLCKQLRNYPTSPH